MCNPERPSGCDMAFVTLDLQVIASPPRELQHSLTRRPSGLPEGRLEFA